MELDHRDITALAEFFAKRFPDWRDRQELAKAARVPMAGDSSAQVASAVDGWTDLLQRTSNSGAMLRLARAASQRDPGDENLQSVCRLLGGPRFDHADHRGGSRLALAALALIATGLGVWMWQGRTPTTSPPPSQTPSALTQARTPPTELVAVASSDTPTAHPWVDGNPLDTPTTPPQKTPPAAAGTDEATGTDRPVDLGPTDTTPAHHDGRCSTPDGGLVGYWYAGDASPGRAGQTIEMNRSVYVRADYPDKHNNYAHDAAIRCSLVEGDTVRLSADPILVPGDRYWVPIHSGDLLR